MLSAGPATISELVRGSGVICTSSSRPARSSFRPLASTESNSSAAFFWVGGPALRRADGRLQRAGHVGRQGVLQLEHADLADGLALRLVEALHEQVDFLEIARGSLHDQGVGANVGGDLHLRTQARLLGEQVLHGGLHRRGRGVTKAEHAELRLRGDGLIELPDQLLDRLDRFAPADQQQRVRFHQRHGAGAALPAAGQFRVDLLDDHGQRLATDVVEINDVDLRLGLRAQAFDFLDDAAQLLHVAGPAAENDRVQVGQRLHLQVGIERREIAVGRAARALSLRPRRGGNGLCAGRRRAPVRREACAPLSGLWHRYTTLVGLPAKLDVGQRRCPRRTVQRGRVARARHGVACRRRLPGRRAARRDRLR